MILKCENKLITNTIWAVALRDKKTVIVICLILIIFILFQKLNQKSLLGYHNFENNLKKLDDQELESFYTTPNFYVESSCYETYLKYYSM